MKRKKSEVKEERERKDHNDGGEWDDCDQT